MLFNSQALNTSAYNSSSIATVIPPPVITADSTFGVSAIIETRGQGSIGLISANGQGVAGTITASFGVSSSIQERGQGVTGTIDETGQGVEGLI